jgi:hypothetical protein
LACRSSHTVRFRKLSMSGFWLILSGHVGFFMPYPTWLLPLK